MNMKPPLQRTANQLAQRGRFGDTQLVHMNPAEVSGLAAMSPTGELTINPDTGQPEAFLPFLAPLLGSALGTAALGGTLGTAAAGAIGSGLATWAATGDFEKGLISGVTGFGLGKAFGAAGEAGLKASQADAMAEATANLGTHAKPDLGSAILGGNPVDQAGRLSTIPFSPQQTAYIEAAQALPQAGTFGQNLGNIGRGLTSSEGLAAAGSQLMSPSSAIPIAIGESTRANVEAQEELEKLQKDNTARNNRYAQSWRNVLTDSLGMPRGSNPNPYMNRFASGGIVGMENGGVTYGMGHGYEGMSDEEYREMMAGMDVSQVSGLGSGAFGLDADSRYRMDRSKLTPDSGSERQSFLRGDIKQKPPTDYRHGFEKEFQFFDFIEDRPIDRYLDLFGAGPSDYLAGVLAADQTTLDELGTPTAEGTSELATYTETKGDQFSGTTGGITNEESGNPNLDPPPTLKSTCYTANGDGTYSETESTIAGVCPVGSYASQAEADSAWTIENTTTITCYKEGETPQEVSGINPTCPVGWSATQGGGGEEAQSSSITCWNAAGESTTVVGTTANPPSCPIDFPLTEKPGTTPTAVNITCYNDAGESVQVEGTTAAPPSCPVDFPLTSPPVEQTWQEALEALGIARGLPEYDRAQGEAVYDLMQEYGLTNEQIADWFGSSASGLGTGMSAEDVGAAADIIATRRATGETLGGMEADEDYTAEEVAEVYDLLQSGDISLAAAADYFQVSGDEIQANMDAIQAKEEAAEVLGGIAADDDYTQEEIDQVYDLMDDGTLTVSQVADYFGTGYEDVRANQDAIAAQRAAAAADYDNVDPVSILDNPQQWAIDNFGEGPYTQEQALLFAQEALASGLPAADAAEAFGIDEAVVQGFYDQAVNPVDMTDAQAQTAVIEDLGLDESVYTADDFVGLSEGEIANIFAQDQFKGGGRTKRLMTPLGMVHMQDGGIAALPANLPMTQEVPEEMMISETAEVIPEPLPDTDYPELVDMTIEAIRGNVEDPDPIITQFIEEYGVEAFRELREAVLQSIVPNAQTEGRIEGSGGGMDDEVMGMIGESQPVAVSPDEYIVAADVVSGLGDGSSEAGAEVLDEMMANVRKARSGGRQPKPINKAMIVPA